MVRRTSLFLALSLAAFVAGAVALVAALSGEADVGRPALAGAAEERSVDVSLKPSVAPLEATSEPEHVPRSESAALAGQREPAPARPDARWVEGRVIYPPGTPSGERVQIEYKGGGERGSVEVEPDGSFAVAFSKWTLVGRIRLSADHLYLEDEWVRLRMKEVDGPLVLEPLLGGRIVGTLVVTALAPEDVAELAGVPVVARGERRNANGTRSRASREATVDGELAFAFGGLPTGFEYSLSCSPEHLVEGQVEDLTVTPGGTTEVALELVPGVRLTGTVSDPLGQPIEGAELSVWSVHRRDDASWVSPERIEVEADGTFDARGIPPGPALLQADAAGHVASNLDLGELAGGERRDELGLVLGIGGYVEGVCLWPDGSPAEGAKVTVLEAPPEDRGPYVAFEERDLFEHVVEDTGPESVEVSPDGTFRISGVVRAPLTVEAEGRVHADPDAPRDERMRQRREGRRTARLTDVQPNTSGLVLTLGSGLVLAGRVLDDRGRPLEDFTVRARPDGEQVRSRASNGLARAFKDAGGSFAMPGLFEGDWVVRVTAPGHVMTAERVLALPSTDEPSFVLSRYAVVRGVVQDPSGRGVNGASVTAATAKSGYSSTESSARAAADGTFEIEDVTPGLIEVSATTTLLTSSAPTKLTLAPGATAELTLVVRAGGTLVGELLSTQGQSVVEREVTLRDESWGTNENTSTDERGRFVFEHVVPGSYIVEAQPGPFPEIDEEGDFDGSAWRAATSRASVEIFSGETVRVVLGAPPAPTIEVTGVVRHAGEPAAGIDVWALGESQAAQFDPAHARTDANGSYAIGVHGPGRYGFFVGSGGSNTLHERTIPDVGRHELDFELPSGRIAGRVLGPEGAPRGDIWLRLQPDASVERGAFPGHVSSDENGAFAFENLNAGTYSITVEGGAPWGAGAPEYGSLQRGGLRVSGETGPDDIVIRLPHPAALEGTVRDANGDLAGGASLFVRTGTGSLLQLAATTDAAGRFHFPALGPGTWTISARRGNEVSAESASLTLSEGELARVELSLRAGALLHVRTTSGGRSAAAAVSVRDAAGRDHAGMYAFLGRQRYESTPHGVELVGPLPPGTYVVTARGEGGRTAATEVELAGESEREVVLELD